MLKYPLAKSRHAGSAAATLHAVAAVYDRRRFSKRFSALTERRYNIFRPLRHEKDFVRVGVFYFGARRKPANIDVALIRGVRAGHKSGLIWNRNTVRQIAFGRPRCRGSRGLGRRIFFRRLRWRRRLVWIVGLCYGLFGCVWITRHAMTHWRLIIRA